MRAALWGDAAGRRAPVAKVRSGRSSAIAGAKVIARADVHGEDDWDEIAATPDKIHAGIPNLDLNTMTGGTRRDVGHLGFSPVVPLVGADVREVVDFMRELIEDEAPA